MNLIVIVDKNWAIGKDGDQLVYIPEDLKHFKALTLGHPVILGRKTLETFPGKRPLPGRRNLILTKNLNLQIPGGEVFHDLPSLLKTAPKDSFVIGGDSVYHQLLPFCDKACVTFLDAAFEADCYFPNLDADSHWTLTTESEPHTFDGMTYRYRTYHRIP